MADIKKGDNSQKSGVAQTETSKKEISMREISRAAKGIKKAIKVLNELSSGNASIRKTVIDSKINDLLKGEIAKLKNLALQIATKEFDQD